MRTNLPLRVLNCALGARNLAPELIFRSDRGSQSAAHDYRKVLAKCKSSQSMSDAGNCYDNAVAQSFFASLKKERLHHVAFASRTEAYDAVERYIDGLLQPECVGTRPLATSARWSTNERVRPWRRELAYQTVR